MNMKLVHLIILCLCQLLIAAAPMQGAGYVTDAFSRDRSLVELKQPPTAPSMVFLPGVASPVGSAPGYYVVFNGPSDLRVGALNLTAAHVSSLEEGRIPALKPQAIVGRLGELLPSGTTVKACVAPFDVPVDFIGTTADPAKFNSSATWFRVKDGSQAGYFLVSSRLATAELAKAFPLRWVNELPAPSQELKVAGVWSEASRPGDEFHLVIELDFSQPLADEVLRSFVPKNGAEWFTLGSGKIFDADLLSPTQMRLYVDRRAITAPKQFVKLTGAGAQAISAKTGGKLDNETTVALPVRGQGKLGVEQTASFAGGGYSFPSIALNYTYELEGEPITARDATGRTFRDGEKGYALSLKLDAQAKSEFLGHSSFELHRYRLEHTKSHSIRHGFDVGLEGDAGADTVNSIANYSYSLIGGKPMFLTRLFGNGYEETRLAGTVGLNIDETEFQFRGERDEFARLGLFYRFIQRVHPTDKPDDTLVEIDIAADCQYLVEDDFVASFLDAHVLKALDEEFAIDVRYKVGRDAPNFVFQNIITAGLSMKL